MASIVTPQKQPKHRWIQFTAPSGRRPIVRLGEVSTRIAEEHKRVIESIVACQLSRIPMEPRIAEFIGELDSVLRDRYERAGLIPSSTPPTPPQQITLGSFIESFKASRKMDVKASSMVAIGHTMNRLVEHFGEDTPIVEITPQKAREFRSWLASTNKRDKKDPKPLAKNTVNRRTGYCKEIFGQAVQDGVIARNPFHGLTASVRSNKERVQYVPMSDFEKVVAAAPDARWKALLVLARVAALRVPSEVAGLKWDHIRFEEKRILVIDSAKNEHHANRQMRKIPMLPILEKHLLAWQLECQPGERVFPGITGETNLRTTFQKIITRAGVKPWPKLWQNLRASGSTDFARQLPAHVAAAICGHTEEIAKEHYWQVDDRDLDSILASQPDAEPDAESTESSVIGSDSEKSHSEKTNKKPGDQEISRLTNGRRGTRTPDIHFVRVAL
jgi:integrase